MTINTITFDPFKQAKRLQKAGFTEPQIEAQIENVKEQASVINQIIDNNLATKQNIKDLDLKMETNIKELNLKIESIKHEIIIKLSSVIIGCTSLLAVLPKLFN
jgi:hypothetical protein